MELRKDYLLNRWVIVSEGRAKRPHQFVEEQVAKLASCVFCAGREEETPPELERIEEDGKWKIRVIPNLYRAVENEGNPYIQTHNIYYTFATGFGDHEIIVETPFHRKPFGSLSVLEIKEILKIYTSRINELESRPAIKYVLLFKNQGGEAGASIDHAHSQLVSTAVVPPFVMDKINAIKNFAYCPYCDIIGREKNSYRRCYENNSFISFAPYASRFNYEIWVFPKQHIKHFNDIDENMYSDLAEMIKNIAQKIESLNAPYNMEWYYSPEGENIHFHLEFLPRIAEWAGFEYGSGIIINTVSPETAAKFYRGES